MSHEKWNKQRKRGLTEAKPLAFDATCPSFYCNGRGHLKNYCKYSKPIKSVKSLWVYQEKQKVPWGIGPTAQPVEPLRCIIKLWKKKFLKKKLRCAESYPKKMVENVIGASAKNVALFLFSISFIRVNCWKTKKRLER